MAAANRYVAAAHRYVAAAHRYVAAAQSQKSTRIVHFEVVQLFGSSMCITTLLLDSQNRTPLIIYCSSHISARSSHIYDGLVQNNANLSQNGDWVELSWGWAWQKVKRVADVATLLHIDIVAIAVGGIQTPRVFFVINMALIDMIEWWKIIKLFSFCLIPFIDESLLRCLDSDF